jgi:hypothetical protein
MVRARGGEMKTSAPAHTNTGISQRAHPNVCARGRGRFKPIILGERELWYTRIINLYTSLADVIRPDDIELRVGTHRTPVTRLLGACMWTALAAAHSDACSIEIHPAVESSQPEIAKVFTSYMKIPTAWLWDKKKGKRFHVCILFALHLWQTPIFRFGIRLWSRRVQLSRRIFRAFSIRACTHAQKVSAQDRRRN